MKYINIYEIYHHIWNVTKGSLLCQCIWRRNSTVVDISTRPLIACITVYPERYAHGLPWFIWFSYTISLSRFAWNVSVYIRHCCINVKALRNRVIINHYQTATKHKKAQSVCILHNNDVTWASWRLQPPAHPQFVQLFILAGNNETSKLSVTRSLWGDWWIFQQKGQWCRTRFHAMKSPFFWERFVYAWIQLIWHWHRLWFLTIEITIERHCAYSIYCNLVVIVQPHYLGSCFLDKEAIWAAGQSHYADDRVAVRDWPTW